jgi:hypothetical protein
MSTWIRKFSYAALWLAAALPAAAQEPPFPQKGNVEISVVVVALKTADVLLRGR